MSKEIPIKPKVHSHISPGPIPLHNYFVNFNYWKTSRSSIKTLIPINDFVETYNVQNYFFP